MQTVSVDAMIEDLRTLVEVESPSRDLDALAASAKTVAAVIESRLGGHAVLVESEAGPHVHWSGGGEPKVLILGHHDTVFPLGTLARRPFKVEDGHATGPGVFDMLGGLVQAIHGLAALEDRSGVEILVTADEEVGSRSSRVLIEERALACGAVLVFEGAADGGGLKTGRKGCGTFQVSVAGRASHAGLEPAAGVNALIEAAHQVLDIAALGRPEIGTTVTPTVAAAGTLDNVVPAEATVVVDVRVETAEEKERIEAAFAALTPHLDGGGDHGRGRRSAGPRCPSRRRPSSSRWPSGWFPASWAGRSAAEATATSRPPWGCRPWTASERSEAVPTPTTSIWWSTPWPGGRTWSPGW